MRQTPFFLLVLVACTGATNCADSDPASNVGKRDSANAGSVALAAVSLGCPELHSGGSLIGCYAVDVISALADAHRAATRPREPADGAEDAITLATQFFYASALQREGAELAASKLEAYSSSADSGVSESAKTLVLALNTNRDILLGRDSVLRHRLDNNTTPSTGSAAHELASTRVRQRAAGQLLVLGVGLLTQAMVRADSSGKGIMLTITGLERDVLLGKLQTEFRESLRPVNRSGQFSSDYAAAASVFEGFLAQKWATAR